MKIKLNSNGASEKTMKNYKNYGKVKFSVITRPKSDLRKANSNDVIEFFDITRRELELSGEYITPAECPICNSKNCIREYHPVGFERTLCMDCSNELTYWCARDKDLKPIMIDKSIRLTLEYLTSKEFLSKTPYGIYIMELYVGGICGAAFENDILFSPSQIQDPNIRSITVFKAIDKEVVSNVVFQSLHHLSSSLPIAIC